MFLGAIWWTYNVPETMGEPYAVRVLKGMPAAQKATAAAKDAAAKDAAAKDAAAKDAAPGDTVATARSASKLGAHFSAVVIERK
jgi:hypothetical protein